MTTHSRVLFTAPGRVTTETVDEPAAQLPPGHVRIAPHYLGICGSDLHVLHGGHPFARPPLVPGHELSAVVTETAPDVAGVAVGDRAVIDPIMACGTCRACRAGRPNLCEPPNVAGFRAPGFGRTSHVVPAANVHVAPADLPLDRLAFAEPLACAVHCLSRIPDPADREELLVIGAGTIGLTIVRALRVAGAGRITVQEPDPAKRALARRLGADAAVAPGELPDGAAFTGVIDVVAAQPTLAEATARVVPGGRVVVMGVPNGPREVPLPSMQRFERDLVGSAMYVPADFDTAIGWLADGRFDTEDLITDTFPLRDAEAAYRRAEAPDSIKVLVRLAD
ncbi:alcohol dehydrogenase catalytic domain-containing protein [Streptomyces sp. 3MP-14]|uniref:2-deoxy-scyllo-inosamine dehydrogenase n=1 Tax=Streptomyces mimosae TaxID=2586635 RepID=A0A5N6A597_9ACTN|nr:MULTISPECIES: alcohol dehydrogenase catalytic domain-containing protein [Streptomyces]KAB8163831.1 alcohol dehydrogenase catalytic domain-containing protein [Streptomyces mimosae]KAB8175274.1 alcohol dehydrogenase catalytic domain-containing protein [Streptomyces sp. 3MP-14]